MSVKAVITDFPREVITVRSLISVVADLNNSMNINYHKVRMSIFDCVSGDNFKNCPPTHGIFTVKIWYMNFF
jgi:hypothetical protein